MERDQATTTTSSTTTAAEITTTTATTGAEVSVVSPIQVPSFWFQTIPCIFAPPSA